MERVCSMTVPCGKELCAFCNKAHKVYIFETVSTRKLMAQTTNLIKHLLSYGVDPITIPYPPPMDPLAEGPTILQLGRRNQLLEYMRFNGIPPPPDYGQSLVPTGILDTIRPNPDVPMERIASLVILERWDAKLYAPIFYATTPRAQRIKIMGDMIFPFIGISKLEAIATKVFHKLIVLDMRFNEYSYRDKGAEAQTFFVTPTQAVNNFVASIDPYMLKYTPEVRLRITLGCRPEEMEFYIERHQARLANAKKLISELESIIPAVERLRIELFVPIIADGEKFSHASGLGVQIKKDMIGLVRQMQNITDKDVSVKITVEDNGAAAETWVDGTKVEAEGIVKHLIKEGGRCLLVQKTLSQ